MIKKKIGVDNNFALKEACKNNDIILTAKGVNSQPVSYIDLTGKEKILKSTLNASDTDKINTIKSAKWNREHGRKHEVKDAKTLLNSSTVTVRFKRHSNSVGTQKTQPLHSHRTNKIAVLRESKREG